MDDEDQARMANAAIDVVTVTGMRSWSRYVEQAICDSVGLPGGVTFGFSDLTMPLNRRQRLQAWLKDKRRRFGIWVGGLDDYDY